MVKIRMHRMGRSHKAFYRITAVDSRVKRDGAYIESLGWYDPQASDPDKQVKLDEERVKYWLSVGAQPSLTVRDMLAKRNLVNVDAVKAEHAKKVEAKKKREAQLAAVAASGGEKKEEAKKEG